MIYTSRQKTKSGSHRLGVLTVNGTTKLVKVPVESNDGTFHFSEESIRKVWNIPSTDSICIE